MHLHVVPLFHTERVDCSCQLPDCLGSALPSGVSEAVERVGEGGRKPSPTINKLTRKLCRVGRWGEEKRKVLRRGWRGEATGEAKLEVVVSKPHVGGSMLMVGHLTKWVQRW